MLYVKGKDRDWIGTPLLQETKSCEDDSEGLDHVNSVHARGYGVHAEELGAIRL